MLGTSLLVGPTCGLLSRGHFVLEKVQGTRLIGKKDPLSDMVKRSRASNANTKRKKKKRNPSSSANDASYSEEHHVPKIATAGTLSKIATARNLVKKTRLRTITTSFDATFRKCLPVQQRK